MIRTENESEFEAKPAPAIVDGRRASSIGAIHADGFPIFLHEQVLDDMIDFSEQDLRRERGGFLLGGVYFDTRPYLEIRAFTPAEAAISAAASLRFTRETWIGLNKDIAAKFPNEKVLGWHHTHPGLGVFLSSYDLFIHKHFFPERWQIAVVVDPRRHELRFFQWRGDTIQDCGFILVPRTK